MWSASSSPISRLKPTTSACRIAASFRFRELGSGVTAIDRQAPRPIIKGTLTVEPFDLLEAIRVIRYFWVAGDGMSRTQGGRSCWLGIRS
jgi:hypothetical protein